MKMHIKSGCFRLVHFLAFGRCRRRRSEREKKKEESRIQISCNNSRKNLISHYEQMFHVFPLPYRRSGCCSLSKNHCRTQEALPMSACQMKMKRVKRQEIATSEWKLGNKRLFVFVNESFPLFVVRWPRTNENLLATYFIKMKWWKRFGCMSVSVCGWSSHFF